MIILGIDPGPTTHGFVLYYEEDKRVVGSDKAATLQDVFKEIYNQPDLVAIEAIEAMYAHVGKETVRTIRNVGRLEQYCLDENCPVITLSPQEIKKLVCGTAAAKDPAVRQALLDTLGKPGTKKNKGPTYGVSGHAWRALAAAVAASTYWTTNETNL